MLECPACGFVTARLAGLRAHQYAIHGRAVGTGIRRRSKRFRRQGWPGVDATSSSDADDEGDGCDSPDRYRRRAEPPPPGSGRDDALPAESSSPEPSGTRDETDADAGDSDRDRVPDAGDASGIGIAPLDVDDNGSYDQAVNNAIRALFELTRTTNVEQRPDSQPLPPCEYDYASLTTKVRAVFESLNDAVRSQVLVQKRRGAKLGQFDTPRLRALLRFVLRIGGAGLTHRELRHFYDFLDVWCGTKPGRVIDEDDSHTLRDVFPSATSFVRGVKDEVEHGVISAGWRKVVLTEGGVSYEAYFRPVLDLIMELAKKPGVRLWSGENGPAPPTDARQSPMDGDAFRECEKDVICNNGPSSCVLGVHAYSDGSRISWSGGKF